jgi:hypothetical protein
MRYTSAGLRFVGLDAMSEDIPRNISRFVHIFKGVEDFYFVNKAGELGYIKSGNLRSVKETFPQLKDRAFLNANPNFMRELEDLLRELGEISTACLRSPPYDLELGYVLPAGDQHQWRTSTLVLHKHVLEALKADYDAMIEKGVKELIAAERDLARLSGVRSIHQGLDDLTNHKDAFGRYRYFPALYVIPEQPDPAELHHSKSNLRVINLRWREGKSGQQDQKSASEKQTRELLFSVLRENLTQRGAIDRTQRLENRYSII